MNDLDVLYKVATKDEAATLDALRVRAGFAVRCPLCKAVHDTTNGSCDACGAGFWGKGI